MNQNSVVCGDVSEEYGDYRYSIRRYGDSLSCSKTPLNSHADNETPIHFTQLPDKMREQFRHLLPVQAV